MKTGVIVEVKAEVPLANVGEENTRELLMAAMGAAAGGLGVTRTEGTYRLLPETETVKGWPRGCCSF